MNTEIPAVNDLVKSAEAVDANPDFVRPRDSENFRRDFNRCMSAAEKNLASISDELGDEETAIRQKVLDSLNPENNEEFYQLLDPQYAKGDMGQAVDVFCERLVPVLTLGTEEADALVDCGMLDSGEIPEEKVDEICAAIISGEYSSTQGGSAEPAAEKGYTYEDVGNNIKGALNGDATRDRLKKAGV